LRASVVPIAATATSKTLALEAIGILDTGIRGQDGEITGKIAVGKIDSLLAGFGCPDRRNGNVEPFVCDRRQEC